MDRFSPDGKWWWDGATWIATSDIVLKQLPPTEYELSGRLADARSRMSKRMRLFAVEAVSDLVEPLQPIALVLALPFLFTQQRAFRAYREWTLEQLSLATEQVLGPGEPMVAGETTMFGTFLLGTVRRELAVAVTARHVLIFRIDYLDGQPRWVALAAPASDVTVRHTAGMLGYPKLFVSHEGWVWTIIGWPRVFQPQPVIDAWQRAAAAHSGSRNPNP